MLRCLAKSALLCLSSTPSKSLSAVCGGAACPESACLNGFLMYLQVWDPEKIVIIPDHYIFTSDPRANRNVDILRCALSHQ